ncbi:hypothetical protein EZS27_032214 [termite gut metagenome]|uniref:Outer membrane efflux protein BepC n=1 Tax=termite gut metagenome TaxID=433724 RepID=A0A5J4Q9E5_9ZZZZ
MNKLNMFRMSLCCTVLCPMGVYAQETVRQVITIDEVFALADQNSKSLQPNITGISETHEVVNVAKNACLPDIDVSLAFNYFGDGYLLDRDFSNGMNAPIPHFGNNFAVEVSQVIYSGGAIAKCCFDCRKSFKTVNRSKFTIQRTKEQYDDAKEQTELAIKTDFIKYLETYEQLKTQQKSVELANCRQRLNFLIFKSISYSIITNFFIFRELYKF